MIHNNVALILEALVMSQANQNVYNVPLPRIQFSLLLGPNAFTACSIKYVLVVLLGLVIDVLTATWVIDWLGRWLYQNCHLPGTSWLHLIPCSDGINWYVVPWLSYILLEEGTADPTEKPWKKGSKAQHRTVWHLA